MKGMRSLFRLGALAMITALLVVALTVPTAAADEVCDDMLPAVEIKSVTPVESAFTWKADDLLSYGSGATSVYPTGQLEIRFKDVNTTSKITHYTVFATPSDEPGTSKELGAKEKVFKVDRPRQMGSEVTVTLDLEPGTDYQVDVIAYYYSVRISQEQKEQDKLSATTFLSPPFLGAGVLEEYMLVTNQSPADRGVHYLVYKADQNNHTLRWLDPQTYGPFDHKWKKQGDKVGDWEGPDLLCINTDGDLEEDDCADDDGVGITHYRVTVTDGNGIDEYTNMVKMENFSDKDEATYSHTFPLADGTYTFSVDAGYVVDGKFYPLSDKGQVVFDIPDDYRRYNQDQDEIEKLLSEIVNDVGEEDEDFEAFYDSIWNYEDLDDSGKGDDVADITTKDDVWGKKENTQKALQVYLNNLYN